MWTLFNGAMDLDRLEQGVSQHHNVDRSRSCDSGGGGDAGEDDAGGDGGGGEMGWSQIRLLRFSYFETERSIAAAGCCH